MQENPATDFNSKCHYTRQSFTCNHQRWLRKPCIVHLCQQRVTSKQRCTNLAAAPREEYVNEVCKYCKLHGRGAVNIPMISGKDGPPKSKSQDGERVKAASSSSKNRDVEIKERKTNGKASWGCSEDPKVEGSGLAETKAVHNGKQSDNTVVGNTKEQSKQSTTTTSEGEAPVVQGPVPEVNDSASKPKKPLAEQGWVKVQTEPDWDIVHLEEGKDLHLDNEDHETKDRAQDTKGWVKVTEHKAGESTLSAEEHPDWEVVTAEEGEYQQGVDGMHTKQDEKNNCRMN